MLLRITRIAGPLLLAVLLATPASAQIVQSLQISGGVFVPHGYADRASGDVLVEDMNSLFFSKCTATLETDCIRKEFTSGQILGEWLVAFGDHVELGAGVGYYQGSAPVAYRDYERAPELGGGDIQQDLKLRIIPLTGVVRFLAGHPGTFQPYAGVGIGALNFRYTESGEFIDFGDTSCNGYCTFRNRYTTTGTAPGPILLAGFRAPVKGDIWAFTFEWRYQGGVGNTGGLQNGFLNDKIDLSGNNVNFGVLVRF